MREPDTDLRKITDSLARTPEISGSPGELTAAQEATESRTRGRLNELVSASPRRSPLETGESGVLLAPAPELKPGSLAQEVDDRIYEGTVQLRVEAPSLMQMLQFVDEVCHRPELRLLKLVGNGHRPMALEMWLALREQLNLRRLLLEIEGVTRVDLPSGPGQFGNETVFGVGLAEEGRSLSQGPEWQRCFSLPQMLVESGLLSPEQVASGQRDARQEKLPMADVLVRQGAILPLQLAVLCALHLGLPMVDLRSQDIDPRVSNLLPEEIARRYTVLPLQKQGDRLTVAMVDPTNLRLIQDLTTRTASTIDPVIATHRDVLEQIDNSYRLFQSPITLQEPGGEITAAGERLTPRFLRNAPPVQIIDLLLRQALQDRASDIHIEAAEDRLRIRFRIDSILQDVMDLPLDLHPILISRIKIMAGMNIAERRRAQDGQFTVEAGGRRVDVRVAVSNTVEGEMTVRRLLDKKFTLIGLDQLGMSRESLAKYRQLLRIPYGMIIICGPTGAGKSTTLYASVLQINRMEQNVISLEDPVEYHIANTNQMQVHAEAGVTFAAQLRSILRLDPDVILVGEIRDQETAIIATQAALTGHLVLTSLHANDSVSALLRFRDLGVPPYLIASSVAGIVAQRMVRVVCNNCQAMVTRPLEEQEAFAEEMTERQERFFYGQGCNMCAGTGYRERTGVFETLVMTDAIRQLLLEDAPRHQLSDQALREGMTPLRRDGMEKVKAGVTTPYEVLRVLFSLE